MTEVEKNRDDHTDVLPEDLNAVDNRLPFKYPDNSRRRIPGSIYAILGVVVTVIGLVLRDDAVLVNDGLVAGGVVLFLVGLFSVSSGWRMTVDEQEALALAGPAVNFTIGHASAQQVWRGLRSRPTWRVLCYSDEEPPRQRGLVLVDAVDGRVVQSLVESSSDEWSSPN
jgi:hypothetical protein